MINVKNIKKLIEDNTLEDKISSYSTQLKNKVIQCEVKEKICDYCNGYGYDPNAFAIKCPSCGGNGIIKYFKKIEIEGDNNNARF